MLENVNCSISVIKSISDSHGNFIENKPIKQLHEYTTHWIKLDQHIYLGRIKLGIFAWSRISAVRQIQPFVNQDILVFIFYAIISPYCDYCCEAVVKHYGWVWVMRLLYTCSAFFGRGVTPNTKKKAKEKMKYKVLNKNVSYNHSRICFGKRVEKLEMVFVYQKPINKYACYVNILFWTYFGDFTNFWGTCSKICLILHLQMN